MTSRLFAFLFVLGALQDPPRDPYLVLGERQVSEGSFDEAVFSLDSAVRRLSDQPGRVSELVEAYVLFAAAYVSLDHEDAARGKFREALRLDPSLRLREDRFPPRVLKVFEAMRLEATSASRKHGARTILILGGVGAAGAVGAAVAVGGHAPSNRPPSATIAVSPEGQAITGITRLTFRASAADPDGDALSYSWDLGDGATASGETVSHVFTGEGAFPVTLTVTDGRGESVTSRLSVTSRTLNGTWQRSDCCADGSRDDTGAFQCTQSGAALDCRRVSATGRFDVVRFAGSLADPRVLDVQLEVRAGMDPYGRCRGEVLPSLDCFRCVDENGSGQQLSRPVAGQCR